MSELIFIIKHPAASFGILCRWLLVDRVLPKGYKYPCGATRRVWRIETKRRVKTRPTKKRYDASGGKSIPKMFINTNGAINNSLKLLSVSMMLLVPSAYGEELPLEPPASSSAVQDRIILKLDPGFHQASRPSTENDLHSAMPNKSSGETAPQQYRGSDINTLRLKYSPALQLQSGMNINNQQQPEHPYSRQLKVPLGARISDALTRQDREAAADILEHERILLNDEMNLLYLAGRKNEAADIAFVLMDRASQDESLYEQAAPILMANARASGVMTTFAAFDSYSAINTEISTSGHQVGRLKLDLSFHQTTRNNVDTTLLASAPDERGGEISLRQSGDSYVNTLKLQSSQALNTQTGISLNHQHQIGSRLKLDTLLAFNQTATENAALRIIGRSDQISLENSYTLDQHNQWILSGGYKRYQSIDGQELGSGNLLSSTLSHEMSGVHPALRTRVTGTWSQYRVAEQALTGKAASLIPAGEPNTAAYFMPQDVSEIAAYASIGDATDNRVPARSLEYLGEVGIFDNPVTGPGWRASAGLAGRIIGADRLHMFLRYDQSPSGQGFSSLEAGIAYLLFY